MEIMISDSYYEAQDAYSLWISFLKQKQTEIVIFLNLT